LKIEIQQDIRTLKQKCNATTIALCPGRVWWFKLCSRTPEKALSVVPYPQNYAVKTC